LIKLIVTALLLSCGTALAEPGDLRDRHGDVQIVPATGCVGPARYGLEKLREALEERGLRVERVDRLEQADAAHVVVAGLSGNPSIADPVAHPGFEKPVKAESLAIRQIRTGDRRTVVLCGADAVGLMYAALDTAERIGWAQAGDDPFAHVRDTSESPFMVDRSVSMYTMHRAWFEERLHDPDYWETYFDMLAASRINSYVIIFGYECAGFMAPMYPYFFDVETFPEVQFNGLSSEEQARNAEALRRVIRLAHARGIRVRLGIWDHIYRARVQAGGIAWAPRKVDKDTPHTVYGVTAGNLAPYTKAALRKLLAVFPEIDGIQFRMHGESGLTHDEIPRFWREVFSMLRELKPTLRFDLRAKGLPDEVIENAIAEDLPFRIGTKFWMEQIGMPFHPTHINPQNQRDRRHGYADLLRFPKRYDVHWRIWSAGTLRMLLWGNPEHVRRFVTESATVYGGRSFEVNEMLATKMLGLPHDREPFKLHVPAARHYDYEIERYWHFYQVWGRISYHPQADPEIWQRAFTRRFGEPSGPLIMRALHRASDILPRIVAASYHYHNFPTTRGWAAMMRLGDMPRYAQGTGTDIEQFESYADAAQRLLDGRTTALRTPSQTAAWFNETARQVLADVAAARAIEAQRDSRSQREFQATITDLNILASLAQYHGARMPAAVWYNVYLKTQDRFALDRCLAGEAAALVAWKRIVDMAEGVYGRSLRFGSRGMEFPEHWREELAALETGYQELKQRPSEVTLDEASRERLRQGIQPRERCPWVVDIKRQASATPGRDLHITAEVESPDQLKSMTLHYRHVTQFEDYRTADMVWDDRMQRYTAVIPGDFILPQWDLMYFVEVMDQQGRGAKVPDLDGERPYVIVPVVR